MKGVVGNLEYGILLLQLFRNETCLIVEGGHLQHLLKHAVRYVQK
jgi:hypothetical protein